MKTQGEISSLQHDAIFEFTNVGLMLGDGAGFLVGPLHERLPTLGSAALKASSDSSRAASRPI